VGTIEIILADYRFDDNSLDFILDDWEFTDLSSLGEVDALSFSFTSTDTGSFGINTPTYFALDNLEFTVVPEPGSTSLALLGTILALSGYRKRSKV